MRRALLSGGVVAVLGLIVALTPFGAGLEERFGLDSLFKLRGERPGPTEVVVVAIDDTTANAIGAPKHLDRWSRTYHARLVDRLNALGAEAILFDVLFSEQHDEPGDAAFAEAVRRAGNVGITYMISREQRPVGSASGAGPAAISIEQRFHPLARFSDAAISVSPFVLPKVPEQVRRYWTFKDGSPSLPLTALQVYGLREYDAWRRLWRQTDPSTAAKLPPDLASEEHRKRAVAMYRVLRQRLQENPGLAHRMLSALEQLDVSGRTRRLLEALIRAHDGDTDRIVNFFGGPGTVQTISYQDIVNGTALPGGPASLEGKAAFVGFSERRIRARHDGFLTVFSEDNGRDLAGVEIAATAFANLLAGEWVRPLPPSLYWGFILLWGLVTGILCSLPGTSRTLFAAPALAAVCLAGTYHLFVAHYLWVPFVIPVMLQAPAAFVLGLAWHYRESRREGLRLKEAFSCYLPPDVVHRYSGEDAEFATGGRIMAGICLFSDAAQYTRLAENMDPAALGELVNEYYGTVFAPVRREGGIISDVVGDAMLALWTAEQVHPDLTARACSAALAVARDTARGARLGVPHGLPTRIGLHSGPILLGNVGAGDHYEYRAVGDTVNTATRLEGLNKLLGTRILASQAVVDSARDLAFRPVGRFILAGKRRATTVYELLCPELDTPVMRDGFLEPYREAISAFEAADWKRARRLFSSLLSEQPHDGPSRYYWLLSESFRKRPPTDWDGIIRLEYK